MQGEKAVPKRVAYYQGCSLEGLASEYDLSTRALCKALGIELLEIPDWNCCGSTPAHSFDPLLSAALAGRNLALASKRGCDLVMSPCPGCVKSLKGALEVYKERKEAFLEVLGMEFEGKVRVVSLLQLLFEEVGAEAVREKVVRSLEGHVIVPYYGCLMTRPATVGFDDPENPVSMDRLIEATGAAAPDFAFKTECCGATCGVTRNAIVGKLSGRILSMASSLGAEAIVVACPLCQQNLDLRQNQVERFSNRSFKLPVVYLTQLLGLALGIDPEGLGLDKLFVNADCLLRDLTGERARRAARPQPECAVLRG
jgi:heterodisulfide reductase subunit B